jgi:hypothetical protein
VHALDAGMAAPRLSLLLVTLSQMIYEQVLLLWLLCSLKVHHLSL